MLWGHGDDRQGTVPGLPRRSVAFRRGGASSGVDAVALPAASCRGERRKDAENFTYRSLSVFGIENFTLLVFELGKK
jgi:hypothetical protein